MSSAAEGNAVRCVDAVVLHGGDAVVASVIAFCCGGARRRAPSLVSAAVGDECIALRRMACRGEAVVASVNIV